MFASSAACLASRPPSQFGSDVANTPATYSAMGGFLMVCVGVLYLLLEEKLLSSHSSDRKVPSSTNSLSRMILGLQVGLIVLATVVTRSSVASLQAKRGLPKGNQVMGWTILGRCLSAPQTHSVTDRPLVTSFTLPFLHGWQPNKHYLHRLVVIFLAFSPVFVILTISYEGLFYFVFCTLLVTWVRLEHQVFTFRNGHRASPSSQSLEPISVTSAISSQFISPNEGDDNHHYRALNLADARIALFFLFLLQAGFFLTGNIASVSSFSLDSVYRLIPVFDPFSQGALLVLKLLIPFAVISANLGILNRRLGVAPSSLSMVVIAISDVLTLNFFWVVKDEGSWLDIGTSISHFVIASVFCVFVALLEFLSEIFVSGVEVDDGRAPVGDRRINGVAAGGRPSQANGKVEMH